MAWGGNKKKPLEESTIRKRISFEPNASIYCVVCKGLINKGEYYYSPIGRETHLDCFTLSV